MAEPSNRVTAMRQPGETIAVNAQLISTETGAHLGVDRFDGERGKLGNWQVEFVEGLRKAGLPEE